MYVFHSLFLYVNKTLELNKLHHLNLYTYKWRLLSNVTQTAESGVTANKNVIIAHKQYVVTNITKAVFVCVSVLVRANTDKFITVYSTNSLAENSSCANIDIGSRAVLVYCPQLFSRTRTNMGLATYRKSNHIPSKLELIRFYRCFFIFSSLIVMR